MNVAFTTVGAFPFEYTASTFSLNASKVSTLLISLTPGSYTVQVSGKNSATGAAFVDIYDVP